MHKYLKQRSQLLYSSGISRPADPAQSLLNIECSFPKWKAAINTSRMTLVPRSFFPHLLRPLQVETALKKVPLLYDKHFLCCDKKPRDSDCQMRPINDGLMWCFIFSRQVRSSSLTVFTSQISSTLLTLPQSAPKPKALISYLSENDMCGYRPALNNGPLLSPP